MPVQLVVRARFVVKAEVGESMTLLLGLNGLRNDDGGCRCTVPRSTPVLGWFEVIKPGCDRKVVGRPTCSQYTDSAEAA